jgi:hypothetical protein
MKSMSIRCRKVVVVALSLLCAACSQDRAQYRHPWSGPSNSGRADAAVNADSASADPADASVASEEQWQPFTPAEPVLAHLTTAQYENITRDLFGAGLTIPELEPDQRLYNFSSIGAARTTLSGHGIDLYAQAALMIAKEVFSSDRRKTIVPCEPKTQLDPACLNTFLKTFGRRVFRRPLSDAEIHTYTTLAAQVGISDPWSSLQYVTAALLQSPNFLYRVELGERAPERPGWFRYTGYEIAARLSLLLRNSAPDLQLLAAAERGELDTAEGVMAAAERLLDDQMLTERMLEELYSEYLDLPLLDQAHFPTEMDPRGTLGQSMREDVLETIKRIALREQGDMRTLFTTSSFMVNTDLAALYGIDAPPAKLENVTLSDGSPRAGILTTGALLTLYGRPNRTSPTLRGLFVRQRLLCGTVPPPPPGIPAIQDTGEAGATIREQLAEHRANPTCAACHQSMDPIGLGMEDFDQFGRYRETYEDGQVVEASGELDGETFTGARQLGALLAENPRATACLVRQLYRYASARLEVASEQQTLNELNQAFSASGYQLRPLLVALVGSDGFRYTVPNQILASHTIARRRVRRCGLPWVAATRIDAEQQRHGVGRRQPVATPLWTVFLGQWLALDDQTSRRRRSLVSKRYHR